MLATSPSELAAGTAIYLNKPSSEPDELIAIVQGSTNLSLDGDYFRFTNPNPPAPELNLSDLDGTNGFVLNGGSSAVSDAGDVNGDGFDDLLIRASGANQSYVVFGKAEGFDTSFDLSSLDGSNGFVINNDRSSFISAVSGAGDINGDGFDDIIIGNENADPNGQQSAGESYVVFGKESFKARFDLSDLDGRNGFALNGNSYEFSGGSVSNGGDINGDGFDDIIIGALARGADVYTQFSFGKNFVVFGKAEGFEVNFELSDLNGRNGFVFGDYGGGDNSGTAQYAGDINGDGFDDLLLLSTARPDSPYSPPSAGRSFLVFGKAEGFDSKLEGSSDFVINDILGDGTTIGSVSGIGDINSDGFDDLIIGTINADFNDQQNTRSSYVVFGKSEGFESSFNLSDINGSNGFVINGIEPGGFFNISVSGAGDVNSDGFDDILIGTNVTDPNGQENAGSSYVIFGKGGFEASFDISDLNGTNGFVINGINAGDGLGGSISAAGDINSDGFDDLIIGASGANESYVIFGRADFTSFVAAT